MKKVVKRILHHTNDLDDEELDKYDYEPASVAECFSSNEQEQKEARLSIIFKSNSIAIDNVNKFQKDMVNIANPLAGTPDEFRFFELSDCDETTKAGALRAMVRAHANMGILEEDGEAKYRFTGHNRFVFVYGDQLTEQRLRNLKPFVMQSLTKIGYEDYVEQLSSALNGCIIQKKCIMSSIQCSWRSSDAIICLH